MDELTKPQKRVLDFIQTTRHRTGTMPTRREIAAQHVRLLRRKAALTSRETLWSQPPAVSSATQEGLDAPLHECSQQ